MNNINIPKAEKFAQIVKWFCKMQDKQRVTRYNSQPPILSREDYKEIIKDLGKKEDIGLWTVLLHWLLYILDRGKRVELVWNKQTANMIVSIMNAKDPVEEAQNLSNKTVAGYPLDWYLVVRTIKYLKPYELNLVNFLAQNLGLLNSPSTSDTNVANFVAKVSFVLYLLSYDTRSGDLNNCKFTKEELPEKLKNLENKTFHLNPNRFEKWLKSERYSVSKRLWCALRDNFAIIGGAKQVPDESGWKGWADLWLKWLEKLPMFCGKEPEEISKLLMPHLEIVADVWNDRFRQNVVSSILLGTNKIGAREIRKLYETLWCKSRCYPPEDYYPMQTDIAFEFAPRMCGRCKDDSLTGVCPFGTFKLRGKMCHKDENMYCPLLGFTLGWLIECESNNCLIAQDRLWADNSPVLCKLNQ